MARGYSIPRRKTTPISKAEQKYVREMIGFFLYYANAVDKTVLTAVNSLTT